jgi:hypothetical protein
MIPGLPLGPQPSKRPTRRDSASWALLARKGGYVVLESFVASLSFFGFLTSLRLLLLPFATPTSLSKCRRAVGRGPEPITLVARLRQEPSILRMHRAEVPVGVDLGAWSLAQSCDRVAP